MNIITFILLMLCALVGGITFGMQNPPPVRVTKEQLSQCHPNERVSGLVIQKQRIRVTCDSGYGEYFKNLEIEK